MDGDITWRPVTPDDFLLLGVWLAQPYVARWWNHETSPEAVERDFGPTVRGEEPNEDLLVLLDGRPFGLVQRCRIAAYEEYLTPLAEIVPVPDDAVSIDYLIGDPELVGRGLGARMIRAVVDDTWTTHPAASCVIVAVSAANTASWRALESAGLARAAVGEMEPDNPVDDRHHVVHRIDRPVCRVCAAPFGGDRCAWSLGREDGGTRWLCPRCARSHTRDIEARLSPEWWS